MTEQSDLMKYVVKHLDRTLDSCFIQDGDSLEKSEETNKLRVGETPLVRFWINRPVRDAGDYTARARIEITPFVVGRGYSGVPHPEWIQVELLVSGPYTSDDRKTAYKVKSTSWTSKTLLETLSVWIGQSVKDLQAKAAREDSMAQKEKQHAKLMKGVRLPPNWTVTPLNVTGLCYTEVTNAYHGSRGLTLTYNALRKIAKIVLDDLKEQKKLRADSSDEDQED